MIGVFLCSPTNSQMFTNCCRTAICSDEGRCPKCKEEVYPGDNQSDHYRETTRWEMAFGPTRRRLAAPPRAAGERNKI